jgi:multiple sugar transport system permease protein
MAAITRLGASPLERHKRVSFYIFLAPWLLGFLLLQVVPIAWGFVISLTNRSAFPVEIKFVGLKNYITLFKDTEVLSSYWVSFVYTVANTLIGVVTGFIFALLLDRELPGRGFFRTILYFPYMIPLVAVGWIFRIFLERDTGFLNILLVRLGLLSTGVPWMQQSPMGSILLLSFWQAGWSMIIFLGALSTVPRELYEVATIDGAGYGRRMRHIMLPLISPFIFFQLVMSFIYAMQAFIQPYIMNPRVIRGNWVMLNPPPNDIFFVMSRAYYIISGQHKFAYGMAMLWVLFAFVLVLTILFVKFGGFWVYTEADEKR